MKKIVKILFLFLFVFFWYNFTNWFFATWEWNDNTSFINERYWLNNFLPVIPYYDWNPNSNDVNWVTLSGYVTQNPYVWDQTYYVDFTDWSFLRLSYIPGSPATYLKGLFPTYSKSLSSEIQWFSVNTSPWIRFFSNTSWQPTLNTWFVQNYWFKRANLIMNLKSDSIEYKVWNSWYNSYSNKNVTISEKTSLNYIEYFPWFWSSQPLVLSDMTFTGLKFMTYWVFNQNNFSSTPAKFDDVLILNVSNPYWTTFSTFVWKSLLLKKWSDRILYTLLDCASPDEFINDPVVCPVLSYGYLSRNSQGTNLDMISNNYSWTNSEYNLFNHPAQWWRSNDYQYQFVLNWNTLQRQIVWWFVQSNFYLISTWSETILQEWVWLTGWCDWWFCWGWWITYWAGGGDWLVPGESGFNMSWRVKSGNVYVSTYWTYIPRTGDLQFTSGLNLFTCPYNMSWFLTLKLSNIPWLSLLSNTSIDFDLFKPITCLYSAYVIGSDNMQKDTFPQVQSKRGSWKLLEFQNSFYNTSSSSRNLASIILNFILVWPMIYLFIKLIK